MSGPLLLDGVCPDGELEEAPFTLLTAERKHINLIRAKQAGVSSYSILSPLIAAILSSRLTSALKFF